MLTPPVPEPMPVPVFMLILRASVPVFLAAPLVFVAAVVPYSTPAVSSGSISSFLLGNLDWLTTSGYLGCIGAGVGIGAGDGFLNRHIVFF